ncbi:uncharacterized protein [Amphiura filiformis]|uniref:uncharacterized protein isoform X2 n=1 Tax=Amphiura filiformis TaxID=82378 RepID=UPI003B21656B
MMFDTGSSPVHPPVPKKPTITPKPSINKCPTVAPKKNGNSASGKSPTPKPKPRTPQRVNRNGGNSVVSPQTNNSVAICHGQGEENNGLESATNITPGELVTSQTTNGESSNKTSPDVQSKLSQDDASQESEEESLVKIQNGHVESNNAADESKRPSLQEKPAPMPSLPNIAEEIKPSHSPDKLPAKKQPPPKPRTPRRTMSVVNAGSPKPSVSKPEIKLTKSHSVLVNGDNSEQKNTSVVEEAPIIPARKKRLSRGTTPVKPFPESNTKSGIDGISESPSPSTKLSGSSPIRPPLPNRRVPLKDCASAKIDEESPPPPANPRRTDTNGNPSVSNRTRAKSEYIKQKPSRPPPPGIKPSLSMALSSNAPPPPKHPKPMVRKTKSQFIPSNSSLHYCAVDINMDDQMSREESDSPRIPPRKRHSKSLDKVLSEIEHSNPDSFVLTQTVYDTESDTVTEMHVGNGSCKAALSESSPSSQSSDNTPDTTQTESIAPRKSMPPSTSKRQPKLQRSLTEPERDSPPTLAPRPKIAPSRKAPLAPPIPVKPIQAGSDNATFDKEKDAGKSSPVVSSKSPPPSPKSFGVKSQSSPKHRPRLPPPPPPPPVEKITDLPMRKTNRTKSLNTTLTSDKSSDPNGNTSRYVKSTVDDENAKNSSKSVNHDIFCNRDSQDDSSSSAVQSISDGSTCSISMNSGMSSQASSSSLAVQSTSDDNSSISRNSVMSEDDDYVLPDPDLQSPPISPRPWKADDQIYINKQVASVRPSRRVAPPRPVKPVLNHKSFSPSSPLISPPSSPTSNGMCPVSPNAFSRTPGSGKLKKKAPAKPVRRSLSINSDVSNDGYEDMSKGSSLASSLGIDAQMADLYSVPRSCEHSQHESGHCTCAQQYAVQSSGEEDNESISDEEGGYENVKDDGTNQDSSEPTIGNPNKAFLVAKEIRDSEKVFVDVLKLLNKDFRQAIDDAGTKEGRPVIEQLLMHQILGHLPQLQMFNEELLQDLDETVENWDANPSISSIFLKKGPYLKLYSSYIRDFEKITTVFDEACGRFPLFGAAVRDFELSERCQNLAIKHYMLKPIQRIPQYKMLLTDYLKQIESGTNEHAETSAALNIVSEVANHANECMRQGDNFGKLLQIQHSLIGNHEIVKPGRVFIKEGELLKLSRKVMQPRKFFLMNDILLYTTPFPPGQYKLNNVLSLAGMRVSKPQLEDFKNELNIISVQRSFTLSANTPGERDEWIEALIKTITDYATKRSSFSVLQPSLIEGDTSSLGRKAPIWIPDSRVTMCMICTCEFTVTWRRHHCRACGKVVCGNCSMNKVPLMYLSQKTARVCEECFNCLAKEECEDDEASGKDRKFKSRRKRSLKETKRPAALKEVSANESDTNMSGYLQVKRKKDWKRMWFVLKGKVLYTYRASEDVAALESMPLLGYEIKIADEYFEGIEPGLVLQLFHQGRVMSVFRTESKAAADKWAYAMVDATVL